MKYKSEGAEHRNNRNIIILRCPAPYPLRTIEFYYKYFAALPLSGNENEYIYQKRQSQYLFVFRAESNGKASPFQHI